MSVKNKYKHLLQSQIMNYSQIILTYKIGLMNTVNNPSNSS